MKAAGGKTGAGASVLCLVEEASERESVFVLHRPAMETTKTPQIVTCTLVMVRSLKRVVNKVQKIRLITSMPFIYTHRY